MAFKMTDEDGGPSSRRAPAPASCRPYGRRQSAHAPPSGSCWTATTSFSTPAARPSRDATSPVTDGSASASTTPRPPFSFVVLQGRATVSEDLGEMRTWATRIAARYMGGSEGGGVRRAQRRARRTARAAEGRQGRGPRGHGGLTAATGIPARPGVPTRPVPGRVGTGRNAGAWCAVREDGAHERRAGTGAGGPRTRAGVLHAPRRRLGHEVPRRRARLRGRGRRVGAARRGSRLDAGCGTGRALPALRDAVGPAGMVLGADLTPRCCDAAADAGRGRYALLVVRTRRGCRCAPPRSTSCSRRA